MKVLLAVGVKDDGYSKVVTGYASRGKKRRPVWSAVFTNKSREEMFLKIEELEAARTELEGW